MSKTMLIGLLSKKSQVSPLTLRRYADAGWIECEIDSAGRRLFGPEAIDRARRLKESRTRKAALGAAA